MLPLMEQAVLCDFIAEGHFGRHLRRMREVYAERLSVFLTAARERARGVVGDLGRRGRSADRGMAVRRASMRKSAARAAAAKEVEVTPLSRYARVGMAREGLQLGFAAVD